MAVTEDKIFLYDQQHGTLHNRPRHTGTYFYPGSVIRYDGDARRKMFGREYKYLVMEEYVFELEHTYPSFTVFRQSRVRYWALRAFGRRAAKPE